MQQQKRGLIKIFLIIVIGVIVLAGFGIDVQGFFEKPLVAKAISALWQVGNTVWDFTQPLLHKIWELMLQYLWTPVTDRLNLGNEVATSTSVSL